MLQVCFCSSPLTSVCSSVGTYRCSLLHASCCSWAGEDARDRAWGNDPDRAKSDVFHKVHAGAYVWVFADARHRPWVAAYAYEESGSWFCVYQSRCAWNLTCDFTWGSFLGYFLDYCVISYMDFCLAHIPGLSFAGSCQSKYANFLCYYVNDNRKSTSCQAWSHQWLVLQKNMLFSFLFI